MKRYIPVIVLICAAAWIIAGMFPRRPNRDAFNFDAFGRIPVEENGRIKPLDTVARTSLLMIHDKQTLAVKGGKSMSAIEWLAELMMDPQSADARKIFVVHDPDSELVGGIFHLIPDPHSAYSFNELQPSLQELDRQAQLAEPIDAKKQTDFQRHVLHLRDQVILYQQLKNSLQPADSSDFAGEIAAYERVVPSALQAVADREAGKPHDDNALKTVAAFFDRYQTISKVANLLIAPPVDPATPAARLAWENQGNALLGALKTGKLHPVTSAYATIIAAYRGHQPAVFNQAVASLQSWMNTHFGQEISKTPLETVFNRFQPFYKSMVLYVAVFLLTCISWLGMPKTLGRTAFYLAVLAFVIHTAGLGLRMYLGGRPPVTNLYSAAVFVGWGAVALGLVLESLFKNGVGDIVASSVGFCTLLIAHHLANDGDTLEMMRAVLDNNFWLATHVVVVTIGYASTYVAGFIALAYVFTGLALPAMPKDLGRTFAKMVYGIVCFATLFSFLGTVLGGIWADQSWGRFWGWDPKENGAVLIVLWNAIILHARWGGMIRERGLITMAIFGNAVTSWSFFGTNMLGIGLHSYGFMNKAFPWLVAFCASQIVMMAIAGLLPQIWAWREHFHREEASS